MRTAAMDDYFFNEIKSHPNQSACNVAYAHEYVYEWDKGRVRETDCFGNQPKCGS